MEKVEHESTSGAADPVELREFADNKRDIEGSAAAEVHQTVAVDEGEDKVTKKTWVVISILSVQYGLSFWPIPTVSQMAGALAEDLGDASVASWYVSPLVVATAIAFMTCGANSDLFGRRFFVLTGNFLACIGNIIGGTSKWPNQVIVGMVIIGFGAGNCQLTAFGVPELLPNKWRHIGIVIADAWVYFAVLVGPAAGRLVVAHGLSGWRWVFYGPAIAHACCFVGIYLLYHPPKHPRGVPWKQALVGLDWVGIVLFVIGGTTTLVGVILTNTYPSDNVRVIATLTVGLVFVAIFGVWESICESNFNLQYPLCPRRVFVRGKGRYFTAPFIMSMMVNMFYYYINTVWAAMVNVFWDGLTNVGQGIALGLTPNIGLVVGGLALMAFGGIIRRWRWTLTASVVIMVLFGALMALARPDRKGMMTAFTLLNQLGFGWACYLGMTYVQLGVEQLDLGVSGGLGGVARWAGGSIASTVFTTVLNNAQSSNQAQNLPKAVLDAGLPQSSLADLLKALPGGAAALATVPGITDQISAVAREAYEQSYMYGIKMTALASLAFGLLGIIACICCVDIDQWMTPKVEVFLENDQYASKNKYH